MCINETEYSLWYFDDFIRSKDYVSAIEFTTSSVIISDFMITFPMSVVYF